MKPVDIWQISHGIIFHMQKNYSANAKTQRYEAQVDLMKAASAGSPIQHVPVTRRAKC
jgi:hypothetical protein